MRFLVDENLPIGVVFLFRDLGHQADYVGQMEELHAQSDNVIFAFATQSRSPLVTQDVELAGQMLFADPRPPGAILLRFPSHITRHTLLKELERHIRAYRESDFQKLIVIEPGYIRDYEL